MISAKFLWGNVLLGRKLQIGTKNSNFEIFESALYRKSVSMPLNLKHPLNNDFSSFVSNLTPLTSCGQYITPNQVLTKTCPPKRGFFQLTPFSSLFDIWGDLTRVTPQKKKKKKK